MKIVCAMQLNPNQILPCSGLSQMHVHTYQPFMIDLLGL